MRISSSSCRAMTVHTPRRRRWSPRPPHRESRTSSGAPLGALCLVSACLLISKAQGAAHAPGFRKRPKHTPSISQPSRWAPRLAGRALRRIYLTSDATNEQHDKAQAAQPPVGCAPSAARQSFGTSPGDWGVQTGSYSGTEATPRGAGLCMATWASGQSVHGHRGGDRCLHSRPEPAWAEPSSLSRSGVPGWRL